METILKSIRDFADIAHRSQMHKYDPDRHTVHPERVMEICRDYDATLPMLAAALLHDVIEDTTVDREFLYVFLMNVMESKDAIKTLKLVTELTDVYTKVTYPQWNHSQRKDKELQRLMHISSEAQTIKYADILDNTKAITSHDPDFAPCYLQECLQILLRATSGNKDLRNAAIDAVHYHRKILRLKPVKASNARV